MAKSGRPSVNGTGAQSAAQGFERGFRERKWVKRTSSELERQREWGFLKTKTQHQFQIKSMLAEHS